MVLFPSPEEDGIFLALICGNLFSTSFSEEKTSRSVIKMAADGENILCILCERNIENGGGTELSHRDHPLFPGSLGTLRDLMMNSICAYYAYSATPLDSASLEFIVSPDSKICDDCLEKMATCIHLQQRSESAAAMMRFASRNGWSNLWPKVSLPLLSPLIT